MQFEKIVDLDLAHGRAATLDLGPMLYQDDINSIKLGVRLRNGSEPVEVEGDVVGRALLSNGATIPIESGEKDGSEAWVVIPQAALEVPGRVEYFMRIYDTDTTAVALYAYGYVRRTTTDTIIVPGDPLPDVEQLRQIAADCEAATETAQGVVNTAVQYTAQTKTPAEQAQARGNISAAEAKLADAIVDGEISAKDGVDFWGIDGSKSKSGITLTKYGAVLTIDGTYTASARRRFNLSGEFEEGTSIASDWYSTAKAALKSGKTYRLTVKEISGSMTFPSGTEGTSGYNLQTYTTAGANGMNAYGYADRVSSTLATSDGTPLGAVILTVNKNIVFDHYTIYIELSEADTESSVVYIDGATGSDDNSGSKGYPLKTIGKAIGSGYRKLRVAPGVYNEKIALEGGTLEILKWEDAESYSAQQRGKVELIYGTALSVTQSGTANIYQASYTAPSGSNIHNVFVAQSVTPTTQGSLSLEYNAMLIGDKPNNAGGNCKQRLYTPVLTENELSAQGTFWYNGSNLIKFHPWNNTLDDAYYIPSDDAGTIIDLHRMDAVYMEDVRVVGAYNYCVYVKRSANVKFVACEFGLCGKGMGLRIDNSNAVVLSCSAFGCAVDGFNLHEYGNSEFYGCSAYYCGDDGISHHQGCTGVIDGGEWAYCGFGSGNGAGIAPTFGSKVDTRNVYSHDNHLGIMQEGTTGKRRTILWNNNVVVDNDTDLYINYYDVVAWGCVYKTKNLLQYGTLKEFANTILS